MVSLCDFDVAYWAWIGTFYLIILTWQDHKDNKMEVDDRKNYLMLGVTLSLISHVDRSLIYLLTLIAFIVLLNLILRKLAKMKMLIFGDGDLSAFTWLFLGFGLINPVILASFAIVWGVLSAGYSMGKAWVFKIKGPIPYFGVLLICYVFVNWFFQIY